MSVDNDEDKRRDGEEKGEEKEAEAINRTNTT